MSFQRSSRIQRIGPLLWGVVVFSSIMIHAQNEPTATSTPNFALGTDAQAAALASQAVTAVLGKNVVQDLTLSGNATWGTGDGQRGAIVLRALGSNESRIDITLPDGTRTEIRDASAGYSQGKWINPDGKSGRFAGHNAMTDAVWFFPAIGSLVAQPGIILSYVGLETRNGDSVQHLRSSAYSSSSPPQPMAAHATAVQFSTMDFYLSASNLLPVAVTFNRHPDSNAGVNIPIEIDFSDYQLVTGVMVPMHIHKSANGATVLDINLTGADFNSGLTLSEFSVN